MFSSDVILNILARTREPEPPPTVIAPTSLALGHAPLADCGRYDGLRRAG